MSNNRTPSRVTSERCDGQRGRGANTRLRQGIALGLVMLAPGFVSSSFAADRLSERTAMAIPSHIAGQRLDAPVQQTADADMLRPSQRIKVLVRLKGKPVAKHFDTSPAGRMSRKEQLKYEQSAFLKLTVSDSGHVETQGGVTTAGEVAGEVDMESVWSDPVQQPGIEHDDRGGTGDGLVGRGEHADEAVVRTEGDRMLDHDPPPNTRRTCCGTRTGSSALWADARSSHAPASGTTSS